MIQLLANGIRDEAESLPHVLLVVDQLGLTLGGGERIVLRLAELLPSYGYRASILTFAAKEQSAALVSARCPVYLLPLTSVYGWRSVKGAFALREFLERERVRVVVTFFESSDLWAGLVTKTMSDAKLVWNRRDMGILRGRQHWLAYRLLSGMPDRVFAVSDEVREHVISVDGVEPERVMTVHNGLDLARWNGEPARGAKVVATLGNIRRVKGHDVLIRAAARVVERFPAAQFVFGGEVLEREYFAELEGLVRELGLERSVSFVGEVRELQPFLSSASVFVLPSRSEGFSNAIVEAMAAGLPVVATRVGGNAEAVENGVNGFIVDSEDVEAMAVAVTRLLEDEAMAQAMGEAGRKIAGERFTTDAMMRKVTDVLAELIG